MIWFEGSIERAVQTSKSKNAIFVVYVEGNDDHSRRMSAMINHPDSKAKLGSMNLVAVKLEAGSESYNQFVQIYQLVPVPSLFFIGKTGAPIEVLPQHLEVDDFLQKLDTIIQKNDPVEADKKDVTTSENHRNQPSTESIENSTENKPTNDKIPISPSTSTENQSEQKTNQSLLTTDEKIERAKQLIEQKRETKRLEEEEKERQKEIERRKVGQDVQKMRRQQQEQELKQLREEILREKNEELAARQKILEQIQMDKEERAKKFNAVIAEAAPPQPATSIQPETKPAYRDTNKARLQFRLADGTSHTQEFPSSNTLQSIREYVRQNLNLPYRNFDLSTTFPRRQFTVEDNARSLIDLELVPNAVILVVPITTNAVTPASTSAASNYFSAVIWFMLSPVLGLYQFLRNTFIQWGNPGPSNSSKRPSEPGPSTPNGPSLPKRRVPPDSTVIRRQGNIHRLSDRKDDSDDENNTWNGNSTQQM